MDSIGLCVSQFELTMNTSGPNFQSIISYYKLIAIYLEILLCTSQQLHWLTVKMQIHTYTYFIEVQLKLYGFIYYCNGAAL